MSAAILRLVGLRRAEAAESLPQGGLGCSGSALSQTLILKQHRAAAFSGVHMTQ